MPVAPSLGEFDYVCKCDKDLDRSKQTVYRLRTLTWSEREDVVSEQNTLATIRKVLNYGLLGWTNFLNENGSDIEFKKTNVLHKDTLDNVQPYAIELANAITDRSTTKESANQRAGSSWRTGHTPTASRQWNRTTSLEWRTAPRGTAATRSGSTTHRRRGSSRSR